jgi:hypothetical protein
VFTNKVPEGNVENERGGVSLRIVMAIVTLVVVGFFIVMLLGKKGENQKIHYGNALTIAEYGLGEALMRLGENFRWRDGFVNQPYNQGSYSVNLDTARSGDTLFLTVEATGRSGQVERRKTLVLRMEAGEQGDSLWRQHAAR